MTLNQGDFTLILSDLTMKMKDGVLDWKGFEEIMTNWILKVGGFAHLRRRCPNGDLALT
jgi:hypothetical protein